MKLAKFSKLVKENTSFLISTHVNPDPDALCSQIALGMYLRAQGKQVILYNEGQTPDRFLFLPGAKTIKDTDRHHPGPYDVAIVLDCGDLGRIGRVQEMLDPERTLVNIDHHITNSYFGDLNIVDSKSSSTSEMIFEMLHKFHADFNKEIALLLYVGIMTDTGSFQYDNTSSRTHSIVSQLLQFEFSVGVLYQKLYETVPLTDLKYFTKVLNSFETDMDGKVISVELRKNIMKNFSKEFDLRDKIFKYLRAVKGVEVVVIFTEEGRELTRANFRAQNKVNVGKLAAHFKGGGHRKASGCLLEYDMNMAKQKIMAEIRKTI